MMGKKELTREELIEINLNDLLYYLQEDNRFRTLKRGYPGDSVVNAHITHKHKIYDRDSAEFLDKLKGVMREYERIEDLALLIMPLGETRGEVLENLGKLIEGNPKLMCAYEDFLERYSNPQAKPELRGAEEYRLRPRVSETLEGMASSGPLDLFEGGVLPQVLNGMEALDRQYCNAYPKRK
jgi:hypothetical protein